jgi:hypothetical protein
MWDFPAKAQIIPLVAERAGIEFAKEVADGALWAAQAVLTAEDFILCKGLVAAASVALDEVQAAGNAAIKLAEGELELANKVMNELVAGAEAALDKVGSAGEAAIKLASLALREAKAASVCMLTREQAVIDGLTSCTEWIAYEAAIAALKVAKVSGSGALLLAEAGVVAADTVSRVAMRAWQFVLSGIVAFVDITDIVLTAELGNAVGGFAFDADIKGTIGDDNFFHFHMEFDTKKVMEFIKAIFEK